MEKTRLDSPPAIDAGECDDSDHQRNSHSRQKVILAFAPIGRAGTNLADRPRHVRRAERHETVTVTLSKAVAVRILPA